MKRTIFRVSPVRQSGLSDTMTRELKGQATQTRFASPWPNLKSVTKFVCGVRAGILELKHQQSKSDPDQNLNLDPEFGLFKIRNGTNQKFQKVRLRSVVMYHVPVKVHEAFFLSGRFHPHQPPAGTTSSTAGGQACRRQASGQARALR